MEPLRPVTENLVTFIPTFIPRLGIWPLGISVSSLLVGTAAGSAGENQLPPQAGEASASLKPTEYRPRSLNFIY